MSGYDERDSKYGTFWQEGWPGRAGAGSEGGSVRQTLRKPVQVPTAGQSSWLSEFIEETGMHRTDQLGYQSSLPK